MRKSDKRRALKIHTVHNGSLNFQQKANILVPQIFSIQDYQIIADT